MSPFLHLLLCPQVHSLHLHLYSCPVNRFISTIFLDSMYMCNVLFRFLCVLYGIKIQVFMQVILISLLYGLPLWLTVKNLPVMPETWVLSLDQEDPLEKGMTTHSSILAWRIPWTEEPGRLQSMALQRVGHDWTTTILTFFHFHSMTSRHYMSFTSSEPTQH